MVCSRLLQGLRDDKHEIFRAGRDAHKAADLMLALEIEKSIDAALALAGKPNTTAESVTEPDRAILVPPQRDIASNSRTLEVEL